MSYVERERKNLEKKSNVKRERERERVREREREKRLRHKRFLLCRRAHDGVPWST